jgi:hypothetical protein
MGVRGRSATSEEEEFPEFGVEGRTTGRVKAMERIGKKAKSRWWWLGGCGLRDYSSGCPRMEVKE